MKPVWIVLLVIGGLFLFVMLLTVLYVYFAIGCMICHCLKKKREEERMKREEEERKARQKIQDQSIGRLGPDSFQSNEGVMSFEQVNGDRSNLGVQPLTPQMVVAGRPQPQVYQFR